MAITSSDLFGSILGSINTQGGGSNTGALFAGVMIQYIPHGGGVI